jgi:Nitrile hydratase, alpha chain
VSSELDYVLKERKFWNGYSALVKRAWIDDAFKQRLLSDPITVFNENNLTVPEGMQVKVLEDQANLRHLPLPMQPTLRETPSDSGEKLRATAGSWFCCHTWSDQETQQG